MGCVCDHCDNGFASFNGVLHSFEWLQVCGGQTAYIAGATAKKRHPPPSTPFMASETLSRQI